MTEFDDSFFYKLTSAIVKAHKQDRIESYQEMYISKIGSYGYMAIEEIDNSMKSGRVHESVGVECTKRIKELIRNEYDS